MTGAELTYEAQHGFDSETRSVRVCAGGLLWDTEQEAAMHYRLAGDTAEPAVTVGTRVTRAAAGSGGEEGQKGQVAGSDCFASNVNLFGGGATCAPNPGRRWI